MPADLYELWDTNEGDGGGPVAPIDGILRPPEFNGPERFSSLDNEGDLAFDIPVTADVVGHAEFATESVVRYWKGSTPFEYRIRTIDKRFGEDGELVRVLAKPIHFDLHRMPFLRRVEGDGTVRLSFEAGTISPSEHLDIILGSAGGAYTIGAPSYFQKGTIEPTDDVDLPYDRDTGWTALKELVKIASEDGIGGFELDFRYLAGGNYAIDLVAQVGSSLAEVPLYLGRNVRRLVHRDSSEEQATRVIATGATVDDELASIARNGFEVLSVSSDQLTMIDDVVFETGALEGMGLYVEKPGVATPVEIVGSTAPNIIDLATNGASGLSAGSIVRLVANAAGDDLVELFSSAAEAITGHPIARPIERLDVPPINNFARDPATTSLAEYQGIGAATVTLNTNNLFWTQGGASIRVVGGAASGLRQAGITLFPTAGNPFATPQIGLNVVSGRIELRVKDPATGIVYPNVEGSDRAITEGEGWKHLVQPFGENLFELGISSLDVEMVFEEAGEFYLDWLMLTDVPQGVPNFYAGRASNLLYLAAARELQVRRDSLSEYDVPQVIDLAELEPGTYGDEELSVGRLVRIVEPASAFEAPSRIRARREFVEAPELGSMVLETELEVLTRQQTQRRRRDVRRQVPPHVRRPSCLTSVSAVLGTDLEVTFGRRNAERVAVRIAGVGGTAQEEFDNGTPLDVVDGDTLVITAPRHTLLSIPRIVADTVNAAGVFGRCPIAVDVQAGAVPPCANVGPGDAEPEYCSPDSAGTIDIHVYQDVDPRSKGFVDGDVGVYQFEGKANETGAPSPNVTELDAIELCEQVGGARDCFVHFVGGVRTNFGTPAFGPSFGVFVRRAVAVAIDSPNSDNDVLYRTSDAAAIVRGTSGVDTDHFDDDGWGVFRVQSDASTTYAAFRRALMCRRERIHISNLPTPGSPGYGVRVERLSTHRYGAKLGILAQDGDGDSIIDYHFDGWFGVAGADRLHVYTESDTTNPLFTFNGPVHPGDQYFWDQSLGILIKLQSGVLFSRDTFSASDLGLLGSGAPVEYIDTHGTFVVDAATGELRGSPNSGSAVKAIINSVPKGKEGYLEADYLRQSNADSIPILGVLGSGPGLGSVDLGVQICFEALSQSKTLISQICQPRLETTSYSLSPCYQTFTLLSSHHFWRWRLRRNGTAQGVGCGRRLQVNGGLVCCTFSPPSGTPPGGGPGNPGGGALFLAGVSAVSVGTCAGTPDVTVTVDWDGDTATFSDSAYHIRITYEEDVDISVGNWQRMHQVSGAAAGFAFSDKTHTETFTGSFSGNHDLRGTDASVVDTHRWRALVELVETATGSVIDQIQTTAFTVGTDYGYC